MSYSILLFILLWAIIGAQIFQFSAYIPRNHWAEALCYFAAGPLVWIALILIKLK